MTRTEYSQRSTARKSQEDRAYTNMISEISAYLAKVRNGRSVQAVNPQAPQFSQSADDARLASRGQVPAGYGAPPKPQESFNPNGFGQAFTTPSGASPSYGFTNSYQPSPQAKVFGQALEALGDERMAGIPAFGGMSKFSKWREFLKGKPTPEMGGFNVPTSKMMKDAPIKESLIGQGVEKPTIREMRDNYFDGLSGADTLNDARLGVTQNPVARMQGEKTYRSLDKNTQALLDEIALKKHSLREDVLRRTDSFFGQAEHN